MTAGEACAVAASAIRKDHPTWEVELCPLSDGSDGFASILTQARHGELVYTTVQGPNFKEVEAHFGVVDCSNFSLSSKSWLKLPDHGTVAIVEAAQACGLAHLKRDERNLWYTSSYGVGELIRLALELKPALLVVGLGGSATHDMGLGALEALGLRFRAENGDLLTHLTPHDWPRVVALEGEIPSKKLPRILLAPNVQNKLLGPRGAATLFGAQKGLKRPDLLRLEEQTARMAELILSHFGAPRSLLEEPGSGASGGLAVGLAAAFKTEKVAGVELADRWLRFNDRVEKANIVITGEGKFDMGSLEGKAPQYVIARSAGRGKRLYCFVGQFVAGEQSKLPPPLNEARIIPIAPRGTSAEESISSSIKYLTEAVRTAFETFK